MRLLTLSVAALLLAGVATPAGAAPPPEPPTGWSYTGSQLVWTAPGPVPPGGAAVEFWEGDRLLGRPLPSADLRSFTLDGAEISGAGELQVRASGRRLDAEEPVRPTSAPPPIPAPLPAGEVDPGKPGPFPTRTGEYELDPIQVPGYAAPIEMRAVVVAPKAAPGERPLALFLHGRHYTCYDGDHPTIAWPCTGNERPVPSHRGYLQAQQLLASQGYVTVSISANGVNGQDAADPEAGAAARSALVREHLARWAGWAGAGRRSAPDIVRTAPAADLSSVLLIGHSRGGEGVNRAAIDSISPPPGGGAVRWKIRGTLLIAPTIFGHNPAPDVPSATILPGCDGDVSDLQGQQYLDATRGVSRGTALHSALYFVGANHNFFNTEWTPGQAVAPAFDDFPPQSGDAVCAPGKPTRLTATQQQTAGATYIAAAARLFLRGDQRVLPLLDGSGVRAPSAGPARVLSHAVGGARTAFVVPDDTTTASGSARMCDQVPASATTGCADGGSWRTSPHFNRFHGMAPESGRRAAALSWSAEGVPAVVRPGRPVSLAGSRDLALRLIVPPNTTGNRFDVAIIDTNGRRAQLGTVPLDGLPATERLSARWAQEVRVPLSRTVDLGAVAALELIPRTASGQAWLIDAYGWDKGLQAPHPARLPRVDVGTLTVEEGDSGTRTVEVPVSVTGDGPGAVRLFVSDEKGAFTEHIATVQPGQHTIEVPMRVTGNTRWGRDRRLGVLVKAVQGTVVGGHTGGLTVHDDDPEPTLTVTPITDRVTEGGVLKWRVTLSAAADDAVFRIAAPLAPGGPELSSTDVDARWFRQRAHGEDPLPSRPLSATTLQAGVYIPPGELSAEVTVPTVADAETEAAEQVRLRLARYDAELTGTVTDPA
ncbi:hypothetical protein Lesp02_62140 [Lentzea sp. NBRC 105346]|uniref:hypothetical protein n=1 Tax=Lentzea sp. NBRC 105346 TaxID=3032205 RepID=UPI0025542993|nr:hypothetical protein [Lentzea sp. NBRC 105346]GLZ34027.1 hypothetical protein Lesp02_62140 [Lentzea sp. NBRC 105346]